MKKLFTLLALLTCFIGAKAEEVVDVEVDFSKYTDISEVKWYGWGASEEAKARLSIVDGCLHFESDEATDPTWACQFHPIGGVKTVIDETYTLHFKIKGDHSGKVSMLGFGTTPYGQFQITDQWVEGTVDYTCVADGDGNPGSGDILMQCGDWIGTWDIAYLKITHEKKEGGKEKVYQEWLTNDGQPLLLDGLEHTNKYVGDAETPWEDWALQTTGEINANWRTARAPEICAWSLTMGRNLDTAVDLEGEKSDRSRPYPTDIEEDPDKAGNHIFAVHVDQIAAIDDDANSIQWSNQFWIMNPKGWKEGETVNIKFRYKAQHACSVGTQWHTMYPSVYGNWNAAGNFDFTEEWKSYDKTLTIHTEAKDSGPFAGQSPAIYSLAFNLCSDETNGRTPNVFYFDDLSWTTMYLEEGYFISGIDAEKVKKYDNLDNAVELVYDDEEGFYIATIGEAGNEKSYVSQVMISTVRGDDNAFMKATLKPGGAVKDDAEDFLDYTESANAKIDLPGLGVWKVRLFPAYSAMSFEMLEGTPFETPDPVDIVTNTTEIVINAVERQPTSAEQPADEGTGTPAGTGATWDNQFFLYSNRNLKPGEVTILEFDYLATAAANSAAAFQGIVEGNPDYITGAFDLKDDTAFGTEEKHFKKELTMPEKKWDGKSVDAVTYMTFDLACIKEANTYTFKNIKWYLKGDENAEGKTLGNLINADGTSNFWVKIGAGTSPYEYGTETGISNVTAKSAKTSTAIYNLAGQRVANGFKGIVVKDGKKFVNK